MKHILFLSLLGTISTSLFALEEKSYPVRSPLVVVISVDQMRADYLTRFKEYFLPPKTGEKLGGFRYLLSKSAYFPQAKTNVLQAMTAPGHATMMTGAYPARSGIPINKWYANYKGVYSIDDPDFPQVGMEGEDIRLGQGVSPRSLRATTVSDEARAAGMKSKIVSIALKSRVATLLAGHMGDAVLWLTEQGWTTSSYYAKDKKLPTWIKEVNKKLDLGKEYVWKGSPKLPSGMSELDDGKPFLRKSKNGVKESASPWDVKTTFDMALRAVDELKMAQRNYPDFLLIGLSAHDALGHMNSFNSRLMEEMTIAEDALIADFLNSLRAKVGAKKFEKIYFVLTADHGIPPGPDWVKAQGLEGGGMPVEKALKELEQIYVDKFGSSAKGPWIVDNTDLNIYLNRDAATDKKADWAQLQDIGKKYLEQIKGVSMILTEKDVLNDTFPGDDKFRTQVRNTYFPGRSGQFIVVPQFYYMKAGTVYVEHHTQYGYDTNVPVVIGGPFIKPGVYGSAAEVVDIAPTLSYLLGLSPPSGSQGRVLTEAIQ